MLKITNNSKQILTIFAALLMSASALGQGMTKGMMSPPANVRPPGLLNVGIEQHLDEQIPPDLNFRDETGKPIRLGDYFGKKPMILNLVYYNCPMLCTQVLNGMITSFGTRTLSSSRTCRYRTRTREGSSDRSSTAAMRSSSRRSTTWRNESICATTCTPRRAG